MSGPAHRLRPAGDGKSLYARREPVYPKAVDAFTLASARTSGG